MATSPNFMVIGAQKCGTTWLSEMLRQHPDVFAPEVKELHFFNLRAQLNQGQAAYERNFEGYNGEKAVGEFTPNYLWQCANQQEIDEVGVVPDIARRIHEVYPDLKLIVCLRNPVDRAVSAYFHFVRSREVDPRASIFDVGHTHGIVSMGYYYSQISEWFRYFDRNQFLFVCYEDSIRTNKLDTLTRVFEFLDVDPSFEPTGVDDRFNIRAGSTYLHLNFRAPRIANSLSRAVPAVRDWNVPQIEVATHELDLLEGIYREANRGLSDLIGLSLPW